MPSYYVPAQDELPSSSSERVVLPGGEDYVLKVLEITEATKPDFNGKMADVFVVKFEAISFADGAPLEDTEGNPVESQPWLWKDIDPAHMGFKTDGTPSLARQFFCAINGIADATQRVPEGDTQDLIGRTVISTLIVYKKKDGNFGNKINTFKTPSRRRGATPGAAVAAPAAPVRTPVVAPQDQPGGADIDGFDSPEYMAAVASLMEDAVTPPTPEPAPAPARRGRKATQPVDDGLEDLPF